MLVKWLVNSLALFAADWLVAGIVIYDFWSGLAAAALLGIVNAVIRPVVIVLTLPITIVTLGLFTLVVNALMLKLVAWAIPDFAVNGFWAAFWGALIISVVSWFINTIFDSNWRISYIKRGGHR
ncbi:MAG: phage holin family protein [Nitrospirae bacterium]|nr:phage holin family protein [Nitrospirota bacterium]